VIGRDKLVLRVATWRKAVKCKFTLKIDVQWNWTVSNFRLY